MKAATTQGFGPKSTLILEENNIPEIGDNDLLVEVYASSVNPKDWKLNKNISSFITSMSVLPKPFIIGDDLAGIVVKHGKNVTKFHVGDKVYGMDMYTRTAACAEYARIDQKRVALKPPSLSFYEAASAPLAALTALQGFYMAGIQQAGAW